VLERAWGFDSLRPHRCGRRPASALRADMFVVKRHALATGHRDVIAAPAPPGNPEQVTAVDEELAYVVRSARELISRVRVVPTLHVDSIEAPPSVRVDQATQEATRLRLHQRDLPWREGDRSVMFAARVNAVGTDAANSSSTT
jgi:hypothetical protein